MKRTLMLLAAAALAACAGAPRAPGPNDLVMRDEQRPMAWLKPGGEVVYAKHQNRESVVRTLMIAVTDLSALRDRLVAERIVCAAPAIRPPRVVQPKFRMHGSKQKQIKEH